MKDRKIVNLAKQKNFIDVSSNLIDFERESYIFNNILNKCMKENSIKQIFDDFFILQCKILKKKFLATKNASKIEVKELLNEIGNLKSDLKKHFEVLFYFLFYL